MYCLVKTHKSKYCYCMLWATYILLHMWHIYLWGHIHSKSKNLWYTVPTKHWDICTVYTTEGSELVYHIGSTVVNNKYPFTTVLDELGNSMSYETLQLKFILLQKHLWCKKKARTRKCKLLNDLKVWNHCEAKKKRYTS